MKFSDINPFMRFAELQLSVMSRPPFNCSYDYRIFYMLDDTASVNLGEEKVSLSAGTLLYFRPGTPYYFDGRGKVIVINFDLTRRHDDIKKPRRPRAIHEFDRDMIIENDPPAELAQTLIIKNAFEVEPKLQECITNFRFPTPLSDAYTSALIKEIICFAVQNAELSTGKIPEIVGRIIEFIRNNYDKELGNEDISAKFGYHSFYLNRVFKQYTGMTLHQAVIKERVSIAKRLLQSTDLSIETVYKESGFSERAKFCTTFRKATGITPTEYRKKKR